MKVSKRIRKMRNYSYANVQEYIPKRYVGLYIKKLQDCLAVYCVMDGKSPLSSKQFLDIIKDVINENPLSWVVSRDLHAKK